MVHWKCLQGKWLLGDSYTGDVPWEGGCGFCANTQNLHINKAPCNDGVLCGSGVLCGRWVLRSIEVPCGGGGTMSWCGVLRGDGVLCGGAPTMYWDERVW